MSTDTFTHKDLSEITGVSVTTIKSYRKKFPEFFFISGHGKPLRFRKGTDKLSLRIRDLFNKNLSVKQIRDKLLIEFESVKDNIPSPADQKTSSISCDEFQKLAKTTDQMMKGLASLVTAQANSEQRLRGIERSLKKLVEDQSAINSSNNAILDEIKNILINAGSLSHHEKITAKKVVTIKKDNGQAESYAFESEKQAEPSTEFLDLPVVIHSETGEFLGMPGRPGHPFTLSEFIYLLTSKKEGDVQKVWRKNGQDWIMSYKKSDGPLYELHFQRTKTPKGNIVSFFTRIDIDSISQNQTFMLSFFREVRDLIESE